MRRPREIGVTSERSEAPGARRGCRASPRGHPRPRPSPIRRTARRWSPVSQAASWPPAGRGPVARETHPGRRARQRRAVRERGGGETAVACVTHRDRRPAGCASACRRSSGVSLLAAMGINTQATVDRPPSRPLPSARFWLDSTRPDGRETRSDTSWARRVARGGSGGVCPPVWQGLAGRWWRSVQPTAPGAAAPRQRKQPTSATFQSAPGARAREARGPFARAAATAGIHVHQPTFGRARRTAKSCARGAT